jgi:hypothetical protein
MNRKLLLLIALVSLAPAYLGGQTRSPAATQEPGYQLFEYACHEGNYAMFNSLSGSRADEQR